MFTRIASGIQLFHTDAGSGQPVVLLHGFPLHHAMWQDQVDVLGKRYRVIAPDLRGFGLSGVGDEAVATMDRMADDVVELLDALEVRERIVLGGLSMGGYVALAFWRKYADRLRALIFCDTRCTADPPAMVRTRQETADRVLAEGIGWLIEGMTPKLLAPTTRENRPHAAEAMRRMALSCDPRGVAAASRGMAERSDFSEQLSHITVPAMAVVGEHDTITPPDEMAELCRAMPHGRFVEIPEAGHMSPMENPSEVNAAILEFLGSL